MEFDLSYDQRAFRDSLSRFLVERYTFEHRRSVVSGNCDEATWRTLAELGVPSLLVPEATGGFGGSAGDILAVCEAFGSALVLQPFLSSCVMSTVALTQAGSAVEVQRTLEHMAAGALRVSWAHDPARPVGAMRAQASDGKWHLSGTKFHVLYGMTADAFIVSALEDEAPSRIGLFLVDVKSTQLRRGAGSLVDDTPFAELTLEECPALKLDLQADAAIRLVTLWGEYASCAEAVGVMDTAFQLSLAHLNQRRQFGKTLSEYQSLRHRVAEMAADLEICRALAIGASVSLNALVTQSDAASEACFRIAQARLVTSRLALRLCETALQIHGGIGMTQEYPVGACLARIACLNHLFGQSRAYARRLAQIPASVDQ